MTASHFNDLRLYKQKNANYSAKLDLASQYRIELISELGTSNPLTLNEAENEEGPGSPQSLLAHVQSRAKNDLYRYFLRRLDRSAPALASIAPAPATSASTLAGSPV